MAFPPSTQRQRIMGLKFSVSHTPGPWRSRLDARIPRLLPPRAGEHAHTATAGRAPTSTRGTNPASEKMGRSGGAAHTVTRIPLPRVCSIGGQNEVARRRALEPPAMAAEVVARLNSSLTRRGAAEAKSSGRHAGEHALPRARVCRS